jgi:hypothetical protein
VASNQAPVLIILNRVKPQNFACSLAQVGEVELEGELLMFKSGEEGKQVSKAACAELTNYF